MSKTFFEPRRHLIYGSNRLIFSKDTKTSDTQLEIKNVKIKH